MSSSYPFFTIARMYGVPYGEVLAIAEDYRVHGIEAIREGVVWARIREAVIAENKRRALVISAERSSTN